jgi:hypothetical protein
MSPLAILKREIVCGQDEWDCGEHEPWVCLIPATLAKSACFAKADFQVGKENIHQLL